jgi:hypothetical protein
LNDPNEYIPVWALLTQEAVFRADQNPSSYAKGKGKGRHAAYENAAYEVLDEMRIKRPPKHGNSRRSYVASDHFYAGTCDFSKGTLALAKEGRPDWYIKEQLRENLEQCMAKAIVDLENYRKDEVPVRESEKSKIWVSIIDNSNRSPKISTPFEQSEAEGVFSTKEVNVGDSLPAEHVGAVSAQGSGRRADEVAEFLDENFDFYADVPMADQVDFDTLSRC